MNNKEILTARDAGRLSDGAFYSKWLMWFFWLNILSVIPGLIANAVTTTQDAVVFASVIGNFRIICCCVAAFLMGTREGLFRTSGILFAVYVAVDTVTSMVGNEMLSLVLTIVSTAAMYAAEYYFFRGCAAILEDRDAGMSAKWRRLWKWFLGIQLVSLLGFYGAMVLVSSAGVLVGLLTIVILGTALIAVVVVRMVYTWQSAKLLRD